MTEIRKLVVENAPLLLEVGFSLRKLFEKRCLVSGHGFSRAGRLGLNQGLQPLETSPQERVKRAGAKALEVIANLAARLKAVP